MLMNTSNAFTKSEVGRGSLCSEADNILTNKNKRWREGGTMLKTTVNILTNTMLINTGKVLTTASNQERDGRGITMS